MTVRGMFDREKPSFLVLACSIAIGIHSSTAGEFSPENGIQFVVIESASK